MCNEAVYNYVYRELIAVKLYKIFQGVTHLYKPIGHYLTSMHRGH